MEPEERSLEQAEGRRRKERAARMEMTEVTVNGVSFSEKKGECLGDILLRQGGISMPCAGNGRCGKCRVRIQGEVSEPDETERRLLSEEDRRKGIRLACRVRILGRCRAELQERKDVEVLLGGSSPGCGEADGKEDGKKEGQNLPVRPMFRHYGAAVDVGTTTLAAVLYDKSGELARAGAENPQTAFGADVISRIGKSLAGEGKLLADSLREGIRKLLQKLSEKSGICVEELDALVITGNTAMLYLLTQRNPDALSHAPFEADWLGNEWLCGKDLGLPCEGARIYLPPCISAFVGADITAAILASGLCGKGSGRMLADIGTNGEIALWKDGKLTCCSTAAGPAFEGAGLSMGMRGEEGAISHVFRIDGQMRAEVIGDTVPVGICGSGVIDAASCLLESGQMDETGYLEDGDAVIAGDVKLTQQDIRMVQLAKSAVCAGMKTMLHYAGMKTEDLKELLVAGGVGNYLRLDSAVKIGLILPLPESRITVCGNAALQGACMLLLDETKKGEAERLAACAHTVSLAADPYFQDCYMEGMLFEI